MCIFTYTQLHALMNAFSFNAYICICLYDIYVVWWNEEVTSGMTSFIGELRLCEVFKAIFSLRSLHFIYNTIYWKV